MELTRKIAEKKVRAKKTDRDDTADATAEEKRRKKKMSRKKSEEKRRRKKGKSRK